MVFKGTRKGQCMSSRVVNLGCNVDINELLRQVSGSIKASSYQSKYFDNNHGRFISVMDGSTVLAASWHDSCWHTATAQGSMSKTAKSDAPPGQWAVAYVSQGLMGNKTFYDWR